MTAQEIRIGNLFSHTNENGTFNIVVKEILEGGINTRFNNGTWFIGLDNINPIPLTEEILLKAGFSRKKSDNTWAFINNEKFIIEYLFERYSFRVVTDRYNSTFLKTIKYRHQLQNLFFALTGEEIKIEL